MFLDRSLGKRQTWIYSLVWGQSDIRFRRYNFFDSRWANWPPPHRLRVKSYTSFCPSSKISFCTSYFGPVINERPLTCIGESATKDNEQPGAELCLFLLSLGSQVGYSMLWLDMTYYYQLGPGMSSYDWHDQLCPFMTSYNQIWQVMTG